MTAEREKSASTSPATGHSGAQVPSQAVSKPRVLVIDDEPTIRAALRRFFKRRDWLFDEASDGVDGLVKLLAPGAEYTAVISDLRMPGVSGIELHDRLAAVRPVLLERIIFSTGDVASHEAAEFVARTRCPVLEKPFELSKLSDELDRVRAKPMIAAPPGAG